MAPLWLAGFGYWVPGIGGGCLLTFPLGLGAEGLWWGLALGLIVTGICWPGALSGSRHGLWAFPEP